MFINNDIPSKFLQHFQFPIDIHGYSFRDKAKIAQAIDCFYYEPPDQNLHYFIIMGDFNANENSTAMETLM